MLYSYTVQEIVSCMLLPGLLDMLAMECDTESVFVTHVDLPGLVIISTVHSNVFLCCSNRPGAVLYPGRWSKEGCETNSSLTQTVCKCNHLTHFAILLSARPLKCQQFALQIIGYIGVSLSLVAMAATVVVFIFLK